MSFHKTDCLFSIIETAHTNKFFIFSVDPNPDTDPELLDRMDAGDGILDLMLKPTLTTYESKDDGKGKDDDDDDD